jgi:hypothetical protein
MFMPNFLRDFAFGAVQGGKGVTDAILEGLRQEKEAKILAQREKAQGILNQLNTARIDETNRANQPKPMAPSYGYAPNGDEWKIENGIKSYTGVNKGKPEKADKSNEPKFQYDKEGNWTVSGNDPVNMRVAMINAGIPINKPGKPLITPSQRATIKKNVDAIAGFPNYKGKDGKPGDPNPLYGKQDSIYSDWTGQTEQVPVDPATDFVGNLRNMIASGANPQATSVPAEQPFTPQQASFVPDMNDPEIKKAYQALQNKQITQEDFDDFAKQRMGQ